jgi:hypothetical protein
MQVLERYKRVHALDSAVHRTITLKIKFTDHSTENFLEMQHFVLCTKNATNYVN